MLPHLFRLGTDFMYRIYFDLSAQGTEFSKAKFGSCRWENLENKRKKKKYMESKKEKTTTSSGTSLCYLRNSILKKTIFMAYCSTPF